jgi:hypothetical protein
MLKEPHVLRRNIVWLTFGTQLFDVGNLNILVGPKGLKVGDELTVRNPPLEI